MKSEFNGFLLVDKRPDCTSFDVVKKLQILTKTKAGHAGTLDPFAEGLLVVAMGSATKVLEFLLDKDKEYVFEITWGRETDSLDRTGKVLNKNDFVPDEKDVRKALEKFDGEISQVPPDFSALKVNGERAYKLAREGKKVVLEARKVKIHEFELLSSGNGKSEFRVACSKGTYVRALARDIAAEVKALGVVSRLKRTKVQYIPDKMGFTSDEIFKLKDRELVRKNIVSTNEVLSFLPEYELEDEEVYNSFFNGCKVSIKDLPFKKEGTIRIRFREQLIALASYNKGFLKSKKLIINYKI
jgi:tRNA pseudouridine55 synthase